MAPKQPAFKKKGEKPPPGPGGRPPGAAAREDAAGLAVEEAWSGQRQLQACGSDFGVDGAWEIAEALWEVDRPLFSLNLRGGTVGADGAALLAEVLGQCHGPLRKLDLSNNNIADDGAWSLAEELSEHSALRTMYLRNNDIGDPGAAHIAGILPHHRSLQELRLDGNKLGPESAKVLAEVVITDDHPGLQVLGLEGNPITDTGAAYLAKALFKRSPPAPAIPDPPYPPKDHPLLRRAPLPPRGGGRLGNPPRGRGPADAGRPGLRVLHLSNCQLTDLSGKSFAQALDTQREGPLRELYLGSNQITDVGGIALAEALEGHETLRVLWLEANKIGDSGSMRFVLALSRKGREDIQVNMAGNRPKRAGQKGVVKSSRFDEAALGDLVRVARMIKALASRGITALRLLKFYAEQVGAGKIDPTISTTADVAKKLVATEMKEYWCSYSVFFTKPQPDCYVIHAWGALFQDLVCAVVRHATGLLNPKLDPDNVYYDRNPKALDKCYFIDVFSVNQNKGNGVLDAKCELDKFEMVMNLVQLRGGEAIVAMDSDWLPLSRMWCLTEVHQALVTQMQLSISFGRHCPFPKERKGWGYIEKSEVTREEDAKVLKSVLGDRGQPKALDGPSKLVRDGLSALIVDRFQADRQILPHEILFELQMLEMAVAEEEEKSALIIQRNLRGYWGRKIAAGKRHERRTRAATVIQVFRRELAIYRRRKLEKKTVTIISKWWREVPYGLARSRARDAKKRAEAEAKVKREAANQLKKKMNQLLDLSLEWCESKVDTRHVAWACAASMSILKKARKPTEKYGWYPPDEDEEIRPSSRPTEDGAATATSRPGTVASNAPGRLKVHVADVVDKALKNPALLAVPPGGAEAGSIADVGSRRGSKRSSAAEQTEG